MAIMMINWLTIVRAKIGNLKVICTDKGEKIGLWFFRNTYIYFVLLHNMYVKIRPKKQVDIYFIL